MAFRIRRNNRRKRQVDGSIRNYDKNGVYSSTTRKTGDTTRTVSKNGKVTTTFNGGAFSVVDTIGGPRPKRRLSKSSGPSFVDEIVFGLAKLCFAVLVAAARGVGSGIWHASAAVYRHWVERRHSR